MKNNINASWLICPNCSSHDVVQSSLVDKDTKEVVKRVLLCLDCDYYMEERFAKINWVDAEKEFANYYPKA